MVTPVWADFVSGSLNNTMSAIAAGATQTMQSTGLADLPSVVDGVSRAKIVLDPFGTQGLPELVYVTSHAAASTTATIQRISGQPLRQHNSSEQWVHGPSAEDFTEFQAQLDNQFHTSVFTAAGQVLASSAAGTPSAVNVGNEYEALTVATAQANKLLYRKLPPVVTSVTRPTQATGAFLGMVISESDTGHVLVCTTLGNPCTWTYVDAAPGSLRPTAEGVLTPGWVWCDGSLYDGTQAAYAALWAVLGTRYGGVSQASFAVPDLRNKRIKGWDPTNSNLIGVAGGRGYAGGANTAVLGSTNIPAHTHAIASHLHSISHNHPNANTASNGDHRHNLGGGAVDTSAPNVAFKSGSAAARLDQSPSIAGNRVDFSGMDLDGAHVHSFDVPNYSGNSGGSGTLTTDGGPGSSAAFSIEDTYITLGYAIRL